MLWTRRGILIGLSLSLLTHCGSKKTFSADDNKKSGPEKTATDTSTETKITTDTSTNTRTGTNTDTSVITNPPVTPSCKDDRSALQGAHFVMMLDNSTSMRDTDCPGMSNGVCQLTAREQTMRDIVTSLKKITAESKDQALSRSSLAVATFTVANLGSQAQLSRDLVLDSVWDSDINTDALMRKLTYLRRPTGDTPYRNAVQLSQQLVDRIAASKASSDTKPNIVVMITDGEPTDADPVATAQLAASLKSKGVKWYTLMLSNATERAARLQVHRGIMLSYETSARRENGVDWFANRYPSFDDYWQNLISLPAQVADKEIVVPSAELMSPAILNEVIHKEITCVPSA